MDIAILGEGGAALEEGISAKGKVPLSGDIGKVRLLIPGFNVEQTIGRLLNEVLDYFPVQSVVVVDDGSGDRTAQIARERGVTVITHSSNLGKGAALKSGFEYLRGMGAGWIMTMDGDLQHDPTLIPAFVEAASKGEYDVIIGRRRRDPGRMPWDRRFSNWSTSLILSLVSGRRIHDSQCGFRLIRGELLDGLDIRGRRYDFETDCLLKLVGRGAQIGWVEIPTMYDDAPSSINRITDTIRFMKVVLRHLLSSRKRGR